jgi:hypothetical protein
MSDRANTITVVLEEETRVDDLEGLLNAIRQMRGVVTAEADVTEVTEFYALHQARHEVRQQIVDILYPKKP